MMFMFIDLRSCTILQSAETGFLRGQSDESNLVEYDYDNNDDNNDDGNGNDGDDGNDFDNDGDDGNDFDNGDGNDDGNDTDDNDGKRCNRVSFRILLSSSNMNSLCMFSNISFVYP